MSLEKLLGRSTTDDILTELKKHGIDLSDDNKSYFLHELRKGLNVIFGVETAELMIEVMADHIKKLDKK